MKNPSKRKKPVIQAHRAAAGRNGVETALKMKRLSHEILTLQVQEHTAKLAETKGLLQVLMDNIPDNIYFKDLEGRFVRNSASQASMLGANDPSLVVGKTDFDFFPHARRSFEEEQGVIRTGRAIIDFEEFVIWPDGRETWVSTTKMPWRDSDGKIIGTFGISRDITDRKRAEEALRIAKADLELKVAERTAELLQANAALQEEIAERRRVDQILRESEERFSKAFFYSPIGITISRQSDNTFTDANDAFLEMSGYERSEIIGHNARDLDLSADPAQREPIIKELQDRGGFRNKEYLIRAKDGTVRHVLMNGQTINIAGEIYMLSLANDITERKRAQETLRESEQKLSIIYNKAPFAGALSSFPDGILIDVNEAFEKVFGYRKAEVLGQTSVDLGINPDLEGRVRITAELRERGRVRDLEVLLRTRSGDARVFLLNIDLVDIGTEKYVLQTVQDITERKQVEEEMHKLSEELEERVADRTRQLEQMNRQLENNQQEIQGILDSMSTLSAKIGLDGTLLFVNRIAVQAAGLPLEELMRTNFLEGPWWSFDPGVHSRVKDAFRQACAGGAINYEEKIFVFGRVLTINFSLTPMLEKGGKIEYILAEGRDISNLIEIEESLQAKTVQLEAANKELEAFSYSVSHDLRAPLRAIDGFSQFLLKDYSDQLPPEGQNYLGRVRAAAQKMSELIDDLLKLSQVSRAPLERKPIDMSDLARKISDRLALEQPERNVSFSIAPDLRSSGDPRLIAIVMENLLNNAWKFTSQKKKAEIQFGADGEREMQTFFVRDNGVGFDMTYVNKLFGAFQRLHNAPEYPGTGIGLATVLRIIRRHGGRAWAEGVTGEGATIYFTLGEM